MPRPTRRRTPREHFWASCVCWPSGWVSRASRWAGAGTSRKGFETSFEEQGRPAEGSSAGRSERCREPLEGFEEGAEVGDLLGLEADAEAPIVELDQLGEVVGGAVVEIRRA